MKSKNDSTLVVRSSSGTFNRTDRLVFTCQFLTLGLLRCERYSLSSGTWLKRVTVTKQNHQDSPCRFCQVVTWHHLTVGIDPTHLLFDVKFRRIGLLLVTSTTPCGRSVVWKNRVSQRHFTKTLIRIRTPSTTPARISDPEGITKYVDRPPNNWFRV